jgi:AraC-like DNA-binding protein
MASSSRTIDGHEWRTRIRVRAPLAALPCPLVACEECRNTPAYHWDGRYRHSEQLAILQCTLSGEGRIRRRGVEHRLPVGTAFLCAADDPEVVYFYPPEATATWRFVFLLFRGGNYRELARDLADRYGPSLKLGRDHPALLGLLALRAQTTAEGLEMSPGEGARLVFALVAALAADSAREGQDAANPLVERGLLRMEAGLTHGAMSVAEVAQGLGVSREHFTRAFRREVGQSPKAWLARRQMIQAARLVKAGMPVKAISARLGYPSAEAFTKAFVRHFRMPPRRFRQDGVTPLA